MMENKNVDKCYYSELPRKKTKKTKFEINNQEGKPHDLEDDDDTLIEYENLTDDKDDPLIKKLNFNTNDYNVSTNFTNVITIKNNVIYSKIDRYQMHTR